MTEEEFLKQIEENYPSLIPSDADEDAFLARMEANFGAGDLYGSLTPAQPKQEEPGLIGRFTGSFAESFSRGVRGLPAGIGSGIASLTGNEEFFDAQIKELQSITEEVSSYNPNPSSFAEVREKFTAGGILPAAGEILDLAVQGIGGSLGYMAPSLGLLTVGTAAAGSTAAAAPWIAMAAFGAAGLTRFAQYFSEQMETSYTEAQKDGKEVDIKDIDLANQVLSAGGQTLLESVPIGAAGLVSRVGKSAIVRNNMNTAAARTAFKMAEKIGDPKPLAAAAATVGSEMLTEQGQNLLQRAAAGQSIDPSDQEAFNSYLETFVSTLLVAGAFGGVAAYNYRDRGGRGKGTDTGTEYGPGLAPVLYGPGLPETLHGPGFADQTYGPAENPETPDIFLAPGGPPITARQAEQEAADRKLRNKAVRDEYDRIAKTDRTVEDVIAALEDRNIDYNSDKEAMAGLSAIIYQETGGKRQLKDATPKEIEKIYERISNLQRFEQKTKIPLTSESEALSFATSLAPKKVRTKQVKQKPKAKTDLVEKIADRLKKADLREQQKAKEALLKKNKEEGQKVRIESFDGLYTVRARAIVNEMIRSGILKNKNKGFVFDVEAISLATDPTLADTVDAVEAILDSREPGDKMEGVFPSTKEVQQRMGDKFRKNFLDQVRSAYLQRGLAEKRDGKIYDRRFLDQRVRDQRGVTAPPTLPTRTTVEKTKAPTRRWVVRDQDTGEIIPGGILKSKQEADKLAAEMIIPPTVSPSTVTPSQMRRGLSPEASLVKPPPQPKPRYTVKPERGFVVEERQYSGDKIVDTKMVDFVPYSKDAAGKADDIVRSRQKALEESTREDRPEFLGGQRIDSPIQKDIVRTTRDARFRNAEKKHEALKKIMSSPGNIASVINRYGLGIDPNGPELRNVNPNQSSVSVPDYDPLSRGAADPLPSVVVAFHGGSRKKGSTWNPRGSQVGSGEGYRSGPLGVGTYFNTLKSTASRYLKYGGKDATVSEVAVDTSGFVNVMDETAWIDRLRNSAKKFVDESVAENLNIFSLFKDVDRVTAYKILDDAGITGAYEKLTGAGDEIAIYDSSVIIDPDYTSSEPAPGYVRVYHGGSNGVDGKRWVSTDREYARNYREGSDLYYLDLPLSHPAFSNALDGQGPKDGFTFNFELSKDEASKLRPVPTDTSFGSVPFDQLGRRTGQSFNLVVKEGVLRPNGTGFGKARLDTQNDAIRQNTRFKGWKEMLDGALEKLGETRYTNTGEMTMFSDGPGRNVLIWNDPRTKEPMVFVFDYFEDGNGPQYHLYNAFVGQDYAANVENVEALRGVESRRGKNVSTDAMFALKNPAHAEQFTQAEMAQHDWSDRRKKGGGTLPVKKPSEKAVTSDKIKADATGAKVVESKYKRTQGWIHFMGKVLDNMTTAIQNWRKAPNMRKPVDVGRFRFTFIDEFDPAEKQDQRLQYEAESEYLNVAVKSAAAYRMLHRMADFFNGVSGYGMIDYFQTKAGDMANGVYRKIALPLTNTTNMRTVRGPDRNLRLEVDPNGGVWTYDKDAQKRVKTNFTRDMYTEGKRNQNGGIRTIFESLTKGDRSLVPELFQYARAVRAMMLQDAEAAGGPRYAGMTDEQINEGLALAAKNPEIAIAYRNLQNWNQLLIDFAQNTGLITQAEADFMRSTDYTPFYLDLDKEANAAVRRMWEDQKSRFKGTGKITTMRDYDVFRDFVGFGKGSDKDIDIDEKLVDGVEATIRNAMGILTSGGRNVALYRTIRGGIAEGTMRPRSEAKRPDDGSFVKIKVNGIEQEFEVDDNLMFEMMAGVDNIPLFQAILNSPGMRALGTFPAQVLRQTVTKTPDFIIPNVFRDSVETFLINAANPRMLLDVWKRIRDNTVNPDSMTGRLLKSKGKREEFDILSLYGVSNGWDSVRSSHRIKGQADALRRAAKLPKDGKRTFEDVLADSYIWNKLTDMSSASESATREVAYAHVYKRMYKKLKEIGKTDEEAAIIAQAEAVHQAVEVMNFNRRGSSQGLRIITAMAPFVNARIQGVDKLARAGMKLGPVGYDNLDPDTVFKNLVNRGKWIAAGSAALAMLNFGDDEYEREHGYRRDDHWFIPIPGTAHYLTIPIPFELGTLFKTVPEQMTRSVLKIATGDASSAGRDALRSALHTITTNFGVGSAIPVSARPIIEWMSNQNLHTGVPIDPYWELDLPAAERYGPRTTMAAQLLGQVTGPVAGLSPRYLDNLVGTIGGGLLTMLWGFADHLNRAPGLVLDEWYSPPRPAPAARDIMLLRRLVTSPSKATGIDAEYYEVKKNLDRVYRLVQDAQGSSRSRMREKYEDELRFRQKLTPVNRQMDQLRKIRKSLLENKEFRGPLDLKRELDRLRVKQNEQLDRFVELRREYDRS